MKNNYWFWAGNYIYFVTMRLIPAYIAHRYVPEVPSETLYIEFGLGYIYCKVCELIAMKGK